MTGCGGRGADGRTGADRAQVVLLAAVVLAVALVPMVVAYHQLGSQPTGAPSDPTNANDVRRSLERAVSNASDQLGPVTWRNRSMGATALNETLDDRLERIERPTTDRAAAISQNTSVAERVADNSCPSGPMRRFGSCVVSGGLVLQERAGRTTLVAVAFDVSFVGPDYEARYTAVVTPV